MDNLLPKGKYRARVTSASFELSQTDKPMPVLEFAIEDGPAKGTPIIWRGSLSENLGAGEKTPFERTIESLRACGWQGTDITAYPGISDNVVSIEVDHEEYKGKTFAKIKWINAVSRKAVSEDRAKQVAAEYKGKIIATDKKLGTTSEDPIPF